MAHDESSQWNPRARALAEAITSRILVLDGATGTWLQDKDLDPEDFGGAEYDGCNEYLVLTRPELVLEMHASYLEAGADIIETNTFGATPLVLDEYGLGDKALEINRRAAELARQAAEKAEAATPGKPRWVAGSMGPTTKALAVTGGITFEELADHYRVQAEGLITGGVDYLLVETCPDTSNIKAAMLGIGQAMQALGQAVPVAISGTIEPTGTMLAGQSVEALYTSIMHHTPLYVGLNCATGPAFMTDHLRSLSALAKCPVGVMPNAGLPDEDGNYLETPEMMRSVLSRFIEEGWVNLVGGCCGTTGAHISAFAQMAEGKPPREAPQYARNLLSGIDFLEITPEMRPIIVGERTNSVGSRAFKRMITEERFDEASDIARRQVRGGAQVIDINLANPDRDEVADMAQFMEQVVRKIKAPLMIDSTDAKVIACALPYCQGKSVINSINLEDGEERFEEVVPLARQYGAALVVGTIDEDPEQGMAVTRERKLAIARRSYDLLTGKYGVDPTDIIFDPLVFPCATGDENYIGSAAETIEGVRLIKEAFPQCLTVLGISNISFGLPPAGREVLNAVFLYHCVQAGLDMAIVNSEKLERYASIPEEEKVLSDNLLFMRGDDPVGAFATHFRDRKVEDDAPRRDDLPLEQRLARYIVEGSRDGLVEDLEQARQNLAPLDIINGPLMEGMSEVGRLFNDNQLIVAEVLQSAEAMKTAVSHLEQFMEKSETAAQGSILLATVKGDVHDIGKNLVDIILTNNGYKVINLGIKCAPETLIEAHRQHHPDLIGLSGLLVKSAQQMVVTAEDLKNAGIETPVLVGGAALSENFTHNRIGANYGGPVAYARDAMHGLELANAFTNPQARDALIAQLKEKRDTRVAASTDKPARPEFPQRRSNNVRIDLPIPPVPDTQRHILGELNLDEVWGYVNPQMLYGKHLGLRGNAARLLEARDPKAMELFEVVEGLKAHCRTGWMKASALWRFFPTTSNDNSLTVLDDAGNPLQRFDFPRQPKAEGLALPDFVLPGEEGHRDHVAFFVVTAGAGIREQAEELKDAGRYLESHALQALALETAEAAAEWLHARLRTMWGFPDPPETTMLNRFQAKYRGKRYSFGYPACPDLALQEPLFRLLEPEKIGVNLTEGHMMEPEASVSALAFHHPDAAYFNAGVREDDE